MFKLSNTLLEYIKNPSNPELNFNLGVIYESIGQTASASSFYLRAAEKTLDKELQYCALLRNAHCFEIQGNRDLTVKTLLQRAISICPNRPEGYFFLSRLHERRKEFHECYCISSIGLQFVTKPNPRIPEYKGEYLLLFQKAIGGWWVGLTEESREILLDLYLNYNLSPEYKILVENNLKNLGYPKRKWIYQNSYINHLKYKFPGVEKIKNNYSQVLQDMFILTVLEGKTNGTYLEIGASDPYYNNNTALLEQDFNWTGVSLEILTDEVQKFKNTRKNPILEVDATKVDYKILLDDYKFPELVDYLQVDCDPASISFDILKNVISSGRKFRVIQFEHDEYAVGSDIKYQSRKFLREHGYELRVSDVSFNRKNSFEDWWVLTDEVNGCFQETNPSEPNFIMDIFYTI